MVDKPSPAPVLSFRRKLLNSVVLLVIIFGLLEGLLALAGVRPVTQDKDPFLGFADWSPLFVPAAGPDGAPIMRSAPNKHLFNVQSFPRDKAPGTRRIFCVGGSTTYGRPFEDTTSFAGWLRELLPIAEPDTPWEVINAGGVSYASYRVARVVKELVEYDPDLIIVYSGQNEFLEERTYRGLRRTPAVVRTLSGLLAHTRVWAALSGVILPDPEPATQMAGEADTLLEHFGPDVYERDDALRAQILAHYRISLERMAAMTGAADTRIVFVTPASNLKDCSPFKSQHTDGLSAAEATEVEAQLARARTLLADGQPATALAELDAALAVDPRYAELHFRRGRALLALERTGEAQLAFEAALAEDVCPLRALPEMQEIVAAVAAATGAPHLDFAAQIAGVAEEELGHPIVGDEHFLDHVHPTIATNGMLAADLVPVLLKEIGLEEVAPPAPDAFAAAAARIDASLDDEMRARSLANLARVIAWSGKHEEAVRPALEALTYDIEDRRTIASAASILATWYAQTGDDAEERHHFRLALAARPDDHDLHFRLGLRSLDRDPPETARAVAHLTYAAVYWQGEHRDAPHFALAGILTAHGQDAAALSHLHEVESINPNNPETAELVNRLDQRLGSAAASIGPPQFTVDHYPSGAVSRIIQVQIGPEGRPVPNGVWTEWHETGMPAGYGEFRQGIASGPSVAWNEAGRRLK